MTSRITLYAGLFFTTLATLMFEIGLTRIFSVSMWYHFSFMAISTAMFGLSAGAMIVHHFPSYFGKALIPKRLTQFAFVFAVSILVSFWLFLQIRFDSPQSLSLIELFPLILIYIVITIPFVMSGVVICLVLTKFPDKVSTLYAADLIGSALGCVLLIPLLEILDGPTAIIAIATLAVVGAAFFAVKTQNRMLIRISLILVILFGVSTLAHDYYVKRGTPILKLKWVKGDEEPPYVYEKWNAYSRITIQGDPNKLRSPFAWGMSWVLPRSLWLTRYLWLEIDADAGTVLTYFGGDLKEAEHLKYDVTNVVHHIKPDADILVIGSGGGRDVLSALAFQQKSVTAVEFNHDTLKAVNEVFGSFTGHLDKHPRVSFVQEEARSYIARSGRKFDIIQSSFIDTWAATAAGAYVLTENGLYTVEAWEIFLKHLKPDGMLTFSRWYLGEKPTEIYRLMALAVEALENHGITNTRRHLMLVKNKKVGTLLVKKEPFTSREISSMKKVSQAMRYQLILTPDYHLNETFSQIASGNISESFYRGYPYNIRPPTDNKPFFFQIHKPEKFFKEITHGASNNPVFVLLGLLITVIVLSVAVILLPFFVSRERKNLTSSWGYLIYFGSIGLGFMLVEISQMQRLIVFLGHPIFGLSTILFSLLLAGGIGSFVTDRFIRVAEAKSVQKVFLILLVLLWIYLVSTPWVIHLFESSETWVRIIVSLVMIVPIGFFMGMPFPIGLKLASKMNTPTAWFWAVNGATSVVGSVLAFCLALFFGITASFLLGIVCYALAYGAIVRERNINA